MYQLDALDKENICYRVLSGAGSIIAGVRIPRSRGRYLLWVRVLNDAYPCSGHVPLQIGIELTDIKPGILVPKSCRGNLPVCNVQMKPLMPLSQCPVYPLPCDPKIVICVQQLSNARLWTIVKDNATLNK